MDFRLRDWSLVPSKGLYLFASNKLALGSNRVLTQWVSMALSFVVKWPGREADYLRPSDELKMPSSIPLLLITVRGLMLNKIWGNLSFLGRVNLRLSLPAGRICCILRHWCKTLRNVCLKLLGYLRLQYPGIWRRDASRKCISPDHVYGRFSASQK